MTQLDDAVLAFVAARAARPHWPGVPIALRPTTIAEGYRLQRAVHTRLTTQGIQQVGYKIGLTSPANQRPWGLNEPVYGGIFTDTRADTLIAALARPLLHPLLECEVAFQLGRDIDARIRRLPQPRSSTRSLPATSPAKSSMAATTHRWTSGFRLCWPMISSMRDSCWAPPIRAGARCRTARWKARSRSMALVPAAMRQIRWMRSPPYRDSPVSWRSRAPGYVLARSS